MENTSGARMFGGSISMTVYVFWMKYIIISVSIGHQEQQYNGYNNISVDFSHLREIVLTFVVNFLF